MKNQPSKKVFLFIFYFQGYLLYLLYLYLLSYFTIFSFNQNWNQIGIEKLVQWCFITKKESFIPSRTTMERLLCVILGFDEIITGYWSNHYKADTCLWRTHWIGPLGVRYTSFTVGKHQLEIIITCWLRYILHMSYSNNEK